MTNDPQAAGFVVAWLYRPWPEARAEFERTYGPKGEWAGLFARGDGYLGSELYRDGETYFLLDRWRSKEAYNGFNRAFGDEYEALSAETERLYRVETKLGAFAGVTGR